MCELTFRIDTVWSFFCVLRARCFLVLCGLMALPGFADETMAQWTMGGRAIALAKAHTALPSDSWAVFHNPAATEMGKATAGFFAIRYYGLRELEDHAVTLSIPLSRYLPEKRVSSAIAAGVHSYGFDLYRESQARIGFAAAWERFRIGLVLNYVHVSIKGYGARGSPLFDAGMIANVTESFRIGWRISHLLYQIADRGETELHPAEMSGGFSWNGISGLLITADVVKDVLYPATLRAAAEAEVFPGVFLRGGWTSRPFTWSAGTGFHIARFRSNLAVQKHEVLGLSPGLDFIIIM